MGKRNRSGIECEIFLNPKKCWLQQTWENLEMRAASNFFLSWLWIGTWLESFVKEFYIIEARRNGQTIGLGILVKYETHFPLSLFKNKLLLHRTGNPQLDQIWIEYNDFLLDQSDEAAIRDAMSSHIVHEMKAQDAFVVGASDDQKFESIERLGLAKRKIWETTNYALDLDELREDGKSVLQFLSRNTRSQILRSMRNYKSIGPITLTKANTAAEAKALLDIAKPYHLARWGKNGESSGFSNPHFMAFHHRLVEKCVDIGVVELFHIKVGDETLSVIYNFKYGNRVYFYLCAINYNQTHAQFKPGLVSHYLLIDRALQQGIHSYDFMGGDARYKVSFSNRQGILSVSQYEHHGWFLNLEISLREVKRRWIGKSTKAIHPQ